ncbi:MAG: hypothetical protein KAQ94_08685 [Arcobacteraceae bacterium]|nr:hypothetical protein [Arcobacteraceae bacterium]
MKYINRAIMNDLQDYLKYFPVLLISGARQIGKSTLALHLKIDDKMYAIPLGFLA